MPLKGEMEMKTGLFFFAVSAMALAMVALADEPKGMVVSGQPDDQTFLAACQAGFTRDFGKSTEAVCFGSGEFTLLTSHKTPPAFKCQQPHSEGMLCVPVKEPLRQLKKEANKPCTRESKKVAWYAFRDSEGILNIAINAKMGDYERSLIWRTESNGNGWEAWATHIVGSTKWLQTEEVCFTWLALGPVKDKKDLERKLRVLSDLRIVEIQP